MGLEGKVALITGGARGIGFAAAELLAQEGVKLALVDINGEAAEQAARSLSDRTQAKGIRADISDEAEVTAMVSAAEASLGPIDIFINSAAVLDDKLFLESSKADWQRMLNVCLMGPMLCLRHILPGMVERGHGRVICLASDSARVGQARLSYYAAAKAGVIALVKSVAQEVGKSGITLNVVSPGATNTPLRLEREQSLRAQMGDEKYARRVNTVLKMYPAGRIGEPDDIGSAIVFLASDRASWITGQVLSVNGGFVMP
ncbi:SDR family NAD(P)-dependent oxidoreductase [Rhodoligotrophos ferricapiens]|uniref:SDR family NAD(P)-dependent oxidoreductase n=1 Tax=Rhodoligotrophos ferricapiens TaxID=3069264 RepID=UPI00315D0C90